MTPDDIKTLRKELSCTAKELAATLETDQPTVLSWERGELFPTKRLVAAMEALRARGPSSIRRTKRVAAQGPFPALADPALWTVIRKLIAHPELRSATASLAASYPDPADE